MARLLPLLTLLIGLLIGGGAGFLIARGMPTSSDPPPSQAKPKTGLTRDDVVGYLHGKTIDLRERDPEGRFPKSLTLDRGQIEAVEIDPISSRTGSDPWWSEVKVVAKTDPGRFALRLVIEHDLIEGKRVFHGLKLTGVAQQ